MQLIHVARPFVKGWDYEKNELIETWGIRDNSENGYYWNTIPNLSADEALANAESYGMCT